MNLKIILLVGLLLGAMAFIAIPVHAMGDNCSPDDNIYPSTITSLLITYPNYNQSNALTTLNAVEHENTTIYLLLTNSNEVSANLTLRTASESVNNNTNPGVTNYSTTMGYPSWSSCLPSDTTNGTLTANQTITVNGTGLECGAPCYPNDYDYVKVVEFHSALSTVYFTVDILMNVTGHTTSSSTISSTTTTETSTSSFLVTSTTVSSTISSSAQSSFSSSSSLSSQSETQLLTTDTTNTPTVISTITSTQTFTSSTTITNNVTESTTNTIIQNITNTQNSTVQDLVQKPAQTNTTSSGTSSTVSLTDIGVLSTISVISAAAVVIVRRRIA